jgi:dolichol-phosphate mannosyltransferase
MGLDSGTAARTTWQVPAFEVPLWAGRRHPWCVTVPVIDEGPRIVRLLERMAAAQIDTRADIVIVDGGSVDGSLRPAALRDAGVRGLLIKTGRGGLSAQLRCAYAFALDQGYRGIVTIDGNDKDDPEAIPRFIEALQQGVDFVQASRYVAGGVAENTPALRAFAIRAIHAPLLSLFSGFRWTDTTQGFRAYSRSMLLDARIAAFRDVFDTYELLAYLSFRAPRLGYRCMELPTARRYPASGGTPTKISAVRGNLRILKILLLACMGAFNPG